MKTILTFILAITFTAMAGQGFTQAKPFQPVDYHQDTIITIQGHNFPVYVTRSGAKFIQGMSNKAETYNLWLGEDTHAMYKSNTVYLSKSGKYYYIKLNHAGQPYRSYLYKN